MAFKKRKGERGEATKYVTRTKACKMLQLALPQFRRLCILKGVYPREPISRVKAQRGDTRIKTLYLKADIIYLSHEPIIWKFRDEKIHRRKYHTLVGKKQMKEAHFKRNVQAPTYKLDHIVLERYPTFDKALEDLDDALSALFLYASLPSLAGIELALIHQSKKLTTEFLMYIIESRSLTKTFISIRGYFYRAHILGHKVTWMIPHTFPVQGSGEVEIRIMKTFVEFYCTLLGFVNYKLFTSLNLYYPPKLAKKCDPADKTSKQEMILNVIESLNAKLQRNFIDEDEGEEAYDKDLITKRPNKKLKLGQEEREKILQQKNLFKNTKFFLGRETNRESLTLVIRSAGGLVSWDKTLGPGYTYPKKDKTIRYEIVDRPDIQKEYLNRFYIQPQWVYDSFNAGVLLPVQNYFVGTELPAHLSPFEEAYHKMYNPPEMERMRAMQKKIDLIGDKTIEELRNNIDALDDDDDDLEEEKEEIEKAKHQSKEKPKQKEAEEEKRIQTESKQPKQQSKEKPKQKEEEERIQTESKQPKQQSKGKPKQKEEEKRTPTESEQNEHEPSHEEEMETENIDEENDMEDDEKEDVLAKMRVRRGKPRRVNLEGKQREAAREDYSLAISFIHRKQKRFFKKIVTQEKKAKRYSSDLRKKRIIYEKEMLKRRMTAAKDAARNQSFK